MAKPVFHVYTQSVKQSERRPADKVFAYPLVDFDPEGGAPKENSDQRIFRESLPATIETVKKLAQEISDGLAKIGKASRVWSIEDVFAEGLSRYGGIELDPLRVAGDGSGRGKGAPVTALGHKVNSALARGKVAEVKALAVADPELWDRYLAKLRSGSADDQEFAALLVRHTK